LFFILALFIRFSMLDSLRFQTVHVSALIWCEGLLSQRQRVFI